MESKKTRMKVFISFRKYTAIIGAQPHEPGQKFSFNSRTFVIFFSSVKFSALSVFGLFEASTFDDYAHRFETITLSLISLLFISVFVMKIEKISELINSFEVLIEKRKFLAKLTTKFYHAGHYGRAQGQQGVGNYTILKEFGHIRGTYFALKCWYFDH